jgi:hypothetical protein
MNGPSFTWPLLMFANVMPESWMVKMGKLYEGRPLQIRTRAELLDTIKPSQRRYLRDEEEAQPALRQRFA